VRNLLFISHRFPYPPDRGEKIRAWHLIQQLATFNRVFLGCLVDDERDWQHRSQLDAICAETGCFPISKRRQKIRTLVKVRPRRPLMLDYYDHRGLHQWIKDVTSRHEMDVVYIFSTAMAPYGFAASARCRILDMVDVDSEKWTEYARQSRWPASLVWAREGRTLLAYERQAALACNYTFLVTQDECRRFGELAPESRGRVGYLENGVDLDFFRPDLTCQNPYSRLQPGNGPWLVLVGNMDYWPNANAAIWFAREILPLLRHREPFARFAIVGANPDPRVSSLAALPGVLVTGRVDDVRPYIAHAAAVVAPLRIARGIQNKVLEGMAMGRPVIASPQAFEGIRAEPGRDLLVADGAEEMAKAVEAVLDSQYPGLGSAARDIMERNYSWPAQVASLRKILESLA
jgi:sugar transferase (PEP-CTERM/EpsH1 system associated)